MRHLLETHGLHSTLDALAEACGWRAHALAAAGRFDTANRLNRAGQALDWVAYTHCLGLNDWRDGQ
jgi:hypothetical protein